jgi:hypothetical protein
LLAKIGDIAKEYGCKKAVAEILEDEGILWEKMDYIQA